MRKKKSTVWVVVHCEFFQLGKTLSSGLFIDEMVFHVAGSLRAAEQYIRARGVMPYSWWKIEQRVVDEQDRDADESPQRHIYDYRGKKRKSEPHDAAQRAFLKQHDAERRRPQR